MLALLNEGLKRKLVLVAAPAGYGKTTLLSEWVRKIAAGVAWLSLDVNDNDPTRFLTYFSAALQAVAPEIGRSAFPPLQSPQPPSVEALLTPLINSIAELGSPIVAVLDDFHLIDTDLIHQALTFLLDNLPPQMHLVIATRSDPHLPLARMRAKGELVELRAADLRFTNEEISVFLHHASGLTVSQDQINKLASRTEGWIAGLQLAAISMQGKKDLDAFIDDFSGSHEYIVDYLTDEVIRGQPDDLRSFLLETSLLDRLSGPLCDAVTGQDAGQATLERLSAANLFILPLDDQRRWYRYHRLFADHLQKRLLNTNPERVGTLHHRASAWHEDNGLTAEAIDHSLRAQDYDRAADLIEAIAEATVMRSEFALILRWTGMLPAPVINIHPMVGFAQAMSLLMTGNPVDQVEQILNGLVCETEEHLGGRSVVQATIAVILGQFSKAYELAQQAINYFSVKANKSLRDIANWIISYSAALESTPSEGLRILDKVVQDSRSSENIMLIVAASYEIAKLYTYQGELQKAKGTFEEVLAQTKDEHGKPLPIAGEGLIGLGELLREENRLEEAEQTILNGIDLSKWGRTATSYRGYISLAKMRLAQGDVANAFHLYQEAKEQAAFEFDQLVVTIAEAKARITQGDLDLAERWLEGRGWFVDSQIPVESDHSIQKHIRKYEQLLQVRVLLARDQSEAALTSLETLLRMMEQQERHDIIIEIQILKALAIQARGDTDEALAALEVSLSLAKPGGYMRVFVDEGESLRRLLIEANVRGMEPEYIGQLLAAFPTQKPRGASPSSPIRFDIVDPLSVRELQVLRLLDSPLTSTEIAEELFISANTARFHIKNIYSKLDVHRRTEAVDRAKDLGLIP
jgi:LuxR family maltose regulon positive regulatory protein